MDGPVPGAHRPLKAIRQMPQFSSLATQSQVATPFQHLIFTFMARGACGEGRDHRAVLSLQSYGTWKPKKGCRPKGLAQATVAAEGQ
ncbi:hypothetical protein Celaphus_00001507 [Cervus elaphus hippelaphus]|uniref:Uncharacterized protein n=1 Tax=Cervus elaphus hippelaphus TaxID=46360 RepID=A0A212D6Z7_CEREH|nr:hypothetical protein Celaphus_00001507 [Cervus elaphus hippelaphus]